MKKNYEESGGEKLWHHLLVLDPVFKQEWKTGVGGSSGG